MVSIRIDIVIRWVAWWVTADVDPIGMLVYSNPVNEHARWELEVCEVNRSKVG